MNNKFCGAYPTVLNARVTPKDCALKPPEGGVPVSLFCLAATNSVSEELIEMADDEMIAMEAYLSVRMWELAEATNPQVNFNPDPMEDEMAEGGHADVQDAIREGIEKMKEEKKD